MPAIGWLGVVAIAGYVTAALAGARVAVLTVTGLTFLGLQGLWQDSMDTLTLTRPPSRLALVDRVADRNRRRRSARTSVWSLPSWTWRRRCPLSCT